MKIYTKTGDTGKTSLFGGGRVSKDSARIEAYGTVDELNSTIGYARSQRLSVDSDKKLEVIQNDLFVMGADLATPPETKATIKRIDSDQITQLELWIDEMEKNLSPLRYFILPGGTPGASAIHISRTVCRRAERCVIQAMETESISNLVVIYLNRLSDFLFVMSRYENSKAGINEIHWKTK
ncbi:MAG TPA: cob(I)yrinic acid a,c-diamide adenosyltransferase [Bacteroidetes bacterium]|nr:cob(I)yrinic acid a,c-diamide adenosyltransferase [Bacteroidota bacterium]